MDERDLELQILRAELAAMTQERDDLAAIVWGKIRGRAPSMNMGGQPSPQTKCAMCGGDCTGQTLNMAYGVRYCDDCVLRHGENAISVHAKRIMMQGGAPMHGGVTAPPPKPPGVLDKMLAKLGELTGPQAAAQRAAAEHRAAMAEIAARGAPPFDPNTTDTQIIDRNEWDAWVASLTTGHTP